ncbi:glycosyltransferase family A protein [Pseudobutyrivibrio xylanivorans]|uniref:Glycosyltransferase n=1 Tax=Pseudobutyrivibrio xylanivorans TaxID=185007 RepID=A0A1G5RXW2_PSEXY|nr:glycosyltransferase family A protein [Pseudobutyrivibrio xylanivorans]SCZ78698.1 hypothetical protein SAMN02910350_01402 [Pseudobutyrivibrio xylanivorans]
MKTCFATVIYKQAKDFFDPLVDSLKIQTDKDFDFLVINDNYSKSELDELNFPDNTILVDCQSQHLSIVQTRIEMLKQAKARAYDLIVLGDADDTISANRIEAYKKAAEIDKTSVFFYNKFVTDTGENVFKNLPKSVTDIKQISQQNFLGLSNTGIRLDAISEEFLDSLKECTSPVFDWYLFTRILMDVGTGSQVEDAATIYRIYEDNVAGCSRDLNKEIDVKTRHYSILSQRYEYFKKMANMLQAINNDSLKLSINHQGYWWSDIQMEE